MSKTRIYVIVWAVFTVVLMIAGSLCSFSFPKGKITDGCEGSIVIDDRAGVLDDVGTLKSGMEKFEEQTGIVTALFTVADSSWKKYYTGGLSVYANELMVTTYDDDYHWVFVISVADDGSFTYASVVGDAVRDYVTTSLADSFKSELKGLSKGDAVSAEIGSAYEKFAGRVLGFNVNIGIFIVFLVVIVAFIVLGVIVVGSVRAKEREEKARVAAANAPKQAKCKFCGGVYDIGSSVCPHCGVRVLGDK
ncbi:MAG: hypothetical protein K6F92_04405 [Lachnospiraceae bacterium]|nr:hypothetical protein [Lachnospiraceae bacterium]